VAKCLCNKPSDRVCSHPTPTTRNREKVCGLALCVKCGCGPGGLLCPSHYHAGQIDAWMLGLMTAAIGAGITREALKLYERDNFRRWAGFFRQGVEPFEAFAEDLEFGKTIDKFYGDKTQ